MTESATPQEHDICDKCRRAYSFTRPKDTLQLYIDEQQYNHVEAKCPHCGHTTIIFVNTATAIVLLSDATTALRICGKASKDVRKIHRAIPRPTMTPWNDELPEIPRDWLTQLHDDLREFGSQ